MADKISVVTPVFNDAAHIRATIESCLSQTWSDVEYIVLDGGSTDGTADIVREYAPRLAYWRSHPDEGLYPALNEAAQTATGTWMIVLNSGDRFTAPDALERAMTQADTSDADVLYGDSVEVDEQGREKVVKAGSDPRLMSRCMIFRHCSALVRVSVQRRFPFDIGRSKRIAYALDSDMFYRVFAAGCRFRKVDVAIEAFGKDGMSNHVYRNLWYNYLITSRFRPNVSKFAYFLWRLLREAFCRSPFYRYAKAFATDFVVNDVLPCICSWRVRRWYLRHLGMRIGSGAFVEKRNYFVSPWLVKIGDGARISRGCTIDARGGVKIGNGASLSPRVSILTSSSNQAGRDSRNELSGVEIGDHARLGEDCTIMQGVTVGRGAVVEAGAVVGESVDPFAVVGGAPAKVVGRRGGNLDGGLGGGQREPSA